MPDEVPFIDFYIALSIPRSATELQIADALEAYQAEMRQQVLNPLTMKSARKAIDVIIPGVRAALLQGEIARRRYVQQLEEFERQQNLEKGAWIDSQGLDEKLRRPFFFDTHRGYDTEQPAYTLREIAARLDTEWVRARSWLIETARSRHPLVLYLQHVALRKTLAEYIEKNVIQRMRPDSEMFMDANIAIERCITLLNPEVERPTAIVDISSPAFNSQTRTLNAGAFLPDKLAQATLTLRHKGKRGCAFGRVVSLTNWLTLPQNQPQMNFALLPEGIDSALGPVLNVPLTFNLSTLRHQALHTAELIIYADNSDTPVEQHVKVQLTVLALPPRVVFESSVNKSAPLRMRAVRRGVESTAIIVPRNFGDEALIPLAGRINSRLQNVRITPQTFHANEPLTISVATGDIQDGAHYNIELNIDYISPGAQGSTALSISGEVLPTFWQNLQREKNIGSRLLNALAGGAIGFLALGFLGTMVAGQLLTFWSFVIPVTLLFALSPILRTITAYRKQVGEIDMNSANVPYSLLLGGGVGGGIVLDLICTLIARPDIDFILSGIIGTMLGTVAGFLMGKVNSTVQKST